MVGKTERATKSNREGVGVGERDGERETDRQTDRQRAEADHTFYLQIHIHAHCEKGVGCDRAFISLSKD